MLPEATKASPFTRSDGREKGAVKSSRTAPAQPERGRGRLIPRTGRRRKSTTEPTLKSFKEIVGEIDEGGRKGVVEATTRRRLNAILARPESIDAGISHTPSPWSERALAKLETQGEVTAYPRETNLAMQGEKARLLHLKNPRKRKNTRACVGLKRKESRKKGGAGGVRVHLFETLSSRSGKEKKRYENRTRSTCSAQGVSRETGTKKTTCTGRGKEVGAGRDSSSIIACQTGSSYFLKTKRKI